MLTILFLFASIIPSRFPDSEIVRIFSARKDASVLIVVPHPDDSSISCAGAILNMKQQGVEKIRCLIMTSGNHVYIPDVETPADRAVIRRKEVVREREILGVQYDFLDLPFYERNHTRPGRDDYRIFTSKVEEFQPDIVFMPSETFDVHSTHRVIAEFSLDVISQLPGPIDIYRYETPWSVFPCDSFNVAFPLSEEMMQTKLESIRAHSSQVSRVPFDIFAKNLAENHAITTPELAGLGGDEPYPFGRYLEVFYRTEKK